MDKNIFEQAIDTLTVGHEKADVYVRKFVIIALTLGVLSIAVPFVVDTVKSGAAAVLDSGSAVVEKIIPANTETVQPAEQSPGSDVPKG